MKSIQRFAKPVSLCLVVTMFLVCVPVHGVLAALISTDTIAKGHGGQAARSTINGLIDREDVQNALIRHGIDPQEAKQRVAALSDAEAVKLAGMLDRSCRPAAALSGFWSLSSWLCSGPVDHRSDGADRCIPLG